jgi:hypothetical protein
MNKLEPDDIKWKFVSSLACRDYHHSKFTNDEFGLEMEKVTKVVDEGFGKPKTYYFITGQEKEYTNLQTLCNDWNEIKNFDDPDSEIIWVKVIRKKAQ